MKNRNKIIIITIIMAILLTMAIWCKVSDENEKKAIREYSVYIYNVMTYREYVRITGEEKIEQAKKAKEAIDTWATKVNRLNRDYWRLSPYYSIVDLKIVTTETMEW